MGSWVTQEVTHKSMTLSIYLSMNLSSYISISQELSIWLQSITHPIALSLSEVYWGFCKMNHRGCCCSSRVWKLWGPLSIYKNIYIYIYIYIYIFVSIYLYLTLCICLSVSLYTLSIHPFIDPYIVYEPIHIYKSSFYIYIYIYIYIYL